MNEVVENLENIDKIENNSDNLENIKNKKKINFKIILYTLTFKNRIFLNI